VSVTNNLGDFVDAMIPFSEQVLGVQLQEAISSGEVSTMAQVIHWVLPGEGKLFNQEQYAKASIADRQRLLKTVLPAFREAKTIAWMNDNDLLILDNFLTVVDHEHYGNLERFADDLVGLFDIWGFGTLVKPLINPLAKAARLTRLAEYTKEGARRLASRKQPASPASVAEKVSPESAREINKLIDDDITGEAAEVLAGTSRSDALAEVASPQVNVADGSVVAKPVALDRHIAEAAYEESSKFYRTAAEIEATRVALLTPLKAAGNVVTRKELTPAPKELSPDPKSLDNGNYQIKHTYSDAAGGWADPSLALKETLENLEYFGVKESDLTLMRLHGNEYKPVTLKDAIGKKAIREELVKKKKTLPDEFKKINMMDDYVVQANFTYSPRALDIVRHDRTVNLNWMDRFSNTAPVPGKSTASKSLLSGAYMLDTNTIQASVMAVDKGNRLNKLIMDDVRVKLFEPLASVGPVRQEVLNQIMIKQNLARRRYTPTELGSMGIVDPTEIKILDNWQHINDQLWHLTNRDQAQTLRNQGYSFYVDEKLGDKIVGKVVNAKIPIANRPASVYDPATRTRKSLSNAEWEHLHNTKGQVIELKRPEVIDDVEVTHIMVQGGDTTRYTKSIQLDDQLVNYFEGQSHIRYKDAWFLERQLMDEAGMPIGKSEAILTSPNVKSADKAIAMFERNASKAQKGKNWRYTKRPDIGLDPIAITEKNFEVGTNAGLSSQRKRGKTLGSFDSTKSTDLSPNLVDPLDSMTQSISELANRIPMREYLDDYAARIIDQFGDLLPKHELTKKPRMPAGNEKLDVSGILTGDAGKRLADLRTNLEHYNMMKFGYHNSLDTGWRNGLNNLGQIAGVASSRMEKFIRATAEEIPSPTGFLRGQAFNAHIALSSPPSQWFVQGIPAGLNGLLHPKYAFGGGLASDWRDLIVGITHEGKHNKVLKELYKNQPGKAERIIQLKKEWDRTGFAAGIDKHLLVEGGIEQILETTRFAKGKALHEAVFGTARKIGFDKGEMFNLGTFWLAARNDAIQNGKSMTNARHFDEVSARTRTLTLNMNKAGEMPWNKNAVSLFTQFMISPYKSMTMYFDRGLVKGDRSKIAAWQGLMMPMPSALTYHVRASVDIDGAEGDAIAEVISNGLLGGVFNAALGAMFENAGSASWQRAVQWDTSMAPSVALIDALMNDTNGISVIKAIAQSSPSLSMYAGYNPIAKNLLKSVGKLLVSPFTADNPEEALVALNAFAGPNGALWQYSAAGRSFSTGYKELLVQKYQKRYSALSGKVSDPSITTPETFAKALFGLETTYQTNARRANTDVYEETAAARNDMDILIGEWQRAAMDQGFNVDDPRRSEYLMSVALEAFPDGIPPKLASYMMGKLHSNKTLLSRLIGAAGMGTTAHEKAAQALRHADPDIQALHELYQSEQPRKDLGEEE